MEIPRLPLYWQPSISLHSINYYNSLIFNSKISLVHCIYNEVFSHRARYNKVDINYYCLQDCLHLKLAGCHSPFLSTGPLVKVNDMVNSSSKGQWSTLFLWWGDGDEWRFSKQECNLVHIFCLRSSRNLLSCWIFGWKLGTTDNWQMWNDTLTKENGKKIWGAVWILMRIWNVKVKMLSACVNN